MRREKRRKICNLELRRSDNENLELTNSGEDSELNVLVPKLQLGNALVCEAPASFLPHGNSVATLKWTQPASPFS